MAETSIGSLRRFYLLKRITAIRNEDLALAAVWHSKQEAEAGAALPATFPHLTDLATFGYVAKEDLDGADVDELRDYASLTKRAAEAVIAAHAAL